MEDKKLLKNEELEKVVGGSIEDYYYSTFYCEKCSQLYKISGVIDTYKCPHCGAELQRTGLGNEYLNDYLEKGI